MEHLTSQRTHEIKTKSLVGLIDDDSVEQLLPKEDSHFGIAPSFFQIAEVFFRRLLKRLSWGHHSSHGSMSVTVGMSVPVLALWTMLVLVHCYK